MATLFISEFAKVKVPQGTYQAQAPLQPSLADQTVAIGGASAESNAFNAATNFVLLSADAACSIAFGVAPKAAATNFYLPANVPLLFAVTPGMKVACITNS